MGSPYPIEKKNQILGRVLSKEITVEQAHREYGIVTSCVYRWLRQVKGNSSPDVQRTQSIPLPRGMNFRAALVAEGYCQEVGFDSPAAGKFCRSKGVTLDEIKRFSTWLAQHDDVELSANVRAREQELINKVTELSEEHKQQNRELQRKEKALAKAAALLVLTKKAQAIWGGGARKNDQRPGSPKSSRADY